MSRLTIIRFITHNDNWDISRQEDADFLYFYLHETTHLHYDELQQLQQFRAFSGVDLRDGYLCIRVLKSEL